MEEKLDAHVESSAKRDQAVATLREDVDELKKDVIEARATVTALRWVGALLFITIPTSAIALFRFFKGA
jgi:hypothetical protein